MSNEEAFEEILVSISTLMVTNKKFYFLTKSIGMDTDDWPLLKSRSIMSSFESLVVEHSYEFACHQTHQSVQGRYGAEIPFNKKALSTVYYNALDEFRLDKLIEGMGRNRAMAKEQMMNYFSSCRRRKAVYSMQEEVKSIIETNEQRIKDGKQVIKIKGWEYLSDAIGGFNPGRVGLLTASTGFGKTALAINLALCAASSLKVLCVNMEMIKQDFGERFVISGSGISYKDWRSGKYDIKRLCRFATDESLKNIWFTDGQSHSIEDIYGLAVEYKSKGLDILIIDYDQKIDLKISRETPEWKALQIAVQELEAIAKEQEIFILLMSQANDAGDPGASKRAKFSASSVLHFYKNADERVFIKAIKNRFGKQGVCIECNYFPEKSLVEEQRIHDKEPEETTCKPLR